LVQQAPKSNTSFFERGHNEYGSFPSLCFVVAPGMRRLEFDCRGIHNSAHFPLDNHSLDRERADIHNSAQFPLGSRSWAIHRQGIRIH
jgi:hypothetical protein